MIELQNFMKDIPMLQTQDRLQNTSQQDSIEWKAACNRYIKVKEFMIEKWFKNLSMEDKLDIVELFNLENVENLNNNYKDVGEKYLLTWNAPGDTKSALFNRLLDGKKALKNAPPTFFSYPWYDVVERHTPLECHHIHFHENNPKNVLIGQTLWEIIEKISDNEFIITHNHWKHDHFTWKIFRKARPLSESSVSFFSAIDGRPISTEQELMKDIHDGITQDNLLFISCSDESQASQLQHRFVQHYGENGVNLFKQLQTRIHETMQVRQAAGKTSLIEGNELQEETQRRLKLRLGHNMLFQNGLIYIFDWQIVRISPTAEILDPSFYLEI